MVIRYLEKLEAIHWENSSSSVANVLGQMLSSVNNLSSTLETSSPEHTNLQHEIQSELNQISELFSDYAERHPSICHDPAAAAAVFEQLQAIRQQQPSLQAAGGTRKPNQKK
ncbi:hypothetical protein BVRB_040830 [Beta vulgaris subsp. vulgaris]|uniref:Uncharacterized protein n=1 Tax=Beta vulgaris subsp. vulgaris TaxID=3555 RepID=A0A0J7YMY4_BETVV|nr:hypothetical protein BVRB_040830 [Beta vulgaris subsp. vulgaris]